MRCASLGAVIHASGCNLESFSGKADRVGIRSSELAGPSTYTHTLSLSLSVRTSIRLDYAETSGKIDNRRPRNLMHA